MTPSPHEDRYDTNSLLAADREVINSFWELAGGHPHAYTAEYNSESFEEPIPEAFKASLVSFFYPQCRQSDLQGIVTRANVRASRTEDDHAGWYLANAIARDNLFALPVPDILSSPGIIDRPTEPIISPFFDLFTPSVGVAVELNSCAQPVSLKVLLSDLAFNEAISHAASFAAVVGQQRQNEPYLTLMSQSSFLSSFALDVAVRNLKVEQEDPTLLGVSTHTEPDNNGVFDFGIAYTLGGKMVGSILLPGDLREQLTTVRVVRDQYLVVDLEVQNIKHRPLAAA